jgi:hypothetical protein
MSYKTSSILAIIIRIIDERKRQLYMYDHGELAWICSSPSNIVSIEKKLGLLGEEFGEVCRAINDNEGKERLIEELIQLAAVAVGIIESLEDEK